MLFSSGQPNWNPFLAAASCRETYFTQLRDIYNSLQCYAYILSALGQRNYTAKYSLSLVRNADSQLNRLSSPRLKLSKNGEINAQ